MKYHDFTLHGYTVSEMGETISLQLVYEHQNDKNEDSLIKFTRVALYNFTHVSGTIITDIEETRIDTLVLEREEELCEWNRMYGVKYWQKDSRSYIEALIADGYRAWEITSAIGFYGFVIAKNVTATQ